MVWNEQNADRSLKNKFMVLFVIIFSTLSFSIVSYDKFPTGSFPEQVEEEDQMELDHLESLGKW